MPVIDAKEFGDLSPVFRGKMGQWFAKFAMRVCALDKINQVCDHSFNYSGAEFTKRFLNDVGVNYKVGNAERLKLLPEGAFITISNHPYGGLDGVITIDLMAGIRADYKFMANNMLSRIKTMMENFILVNPTGNKKNEVTRTNLNAIRETLAHIRGGHPMGFFPSGAVSDFSLKDLRIRDRKWQTSILHLIHKVKVPILPIRFFDTNSRFFYFLGVINWRIRSLRLPSEVFNKREQETRLAIGNIISVQEQEKYPDGDSLGTFLRQTVYEMPKPASFIPKTILKFPTKVD
jgi:putative hemolysin